MTKTNQTRKKNNEGINKKLKKYYKISPHLEYVWVLNLNPLQNDFLNPEIRNDKRDRLFLALLVGRDIAEVKVYVDVDPALGLQSLAEPDPPVLGVAEGLEGRDVRHELLG